MGSTTTTSSARLQNDFGADLWVKNTPKRHPTAGRGLFAGLQDTKSYNVDSGWAKRSAGDNQGFFASLLSRFVGGSYRPPTD
ncbi:hypothetical protein BO78DRAFT_401040 [Aspergillus sclerotiicarbonarius CBS 121057]|uniref:Uncharacterized protein n=1 Tax=Aspergillus sclerotiicarbonarius (strain CBS 121057 / IBT 28362) TaxID=1448318 RepID=A0A319EM10_ASPSB|nr:hypothetical protein BO78DRAFT_401040 [Aspergillus sclerotiicarbonarius CBS 121057]